MAQPIPHMPEPSHSIQPDEQFQFAAQYFSRGEYERAISEYERFIYFFPKDNRVAQARQEIGKSYFALGRFGEALEAFREVANDFPGTGVALDARFAISRCLVKMDDPQNAVRNLEQLTSAAGDQLLIDKAWYEIGWIFVETENWDSAKSSFGRISPKSRIDYDLDNFAGELDKSNDIPRKNPGLAGFLSVIPGGGYLYCGRRQDALMAFLLNSGLIWAGVLAFQNDNPALGAVIGFVGSGFYAGNIYGGINCAHKYNKDRTQEFIENLKRQSRINLSMDVEAKRIGLLFKTEF